MELCFAGVAQLVERQLPKLNVAGSTPVSRSTEGIIYEPMYFGRVKKEST
jgi:hypothetical protein